ncbi:hypothetical protein GX51_08139 [Blastomyces parvus]|uniref:Uncharacterized protein n=1 Tax=Blastomyces parvus TaxID=2060905 RepID=A0A2B7WGF1_9EURO|nr:hypothetical protein GX51_08139 [Blastomyces parvus]
MAVSCLVSSSKSNRAQRKRGNERISGRRYKEARPGKAEDRRLFDATAREPMLGKRHGATAHVQVAVRRNGQRQGWYVVCRRRRRLGEGRGGETGGEGVKRARDCSSATRSTRSPIQSTTGAGTGDGGGRGGWRRRRDEVDAARGLRELDVVRDEERRKPSQVRELEGSPATDLISNRRAKMRITNNFIFSYLTNS